MQKTVYGFKGGLLYMKLTVFFLLMGLLNANARGISQQINFTGKNASLLEIFQTVKQQSGYFIAYDRAFLSNTKPVTIKAVDEPLVKFLNRVLEGQNLSYTIEGTTIIITPEAAAVTAIANAYAGTHFAGPVTGVVRDAEGHPLSGATVRVKGKNLSTGTNEKGAFSIVASEGDVLVVSYIGYVNQEIPVRGGNLAVVLQSSVSNIDSFTISSVVNTGYQRILPQQVTGAVSQIRTKAYESRISTDFLAGLQNRLPGLLINNDVQFQGNNLFQIRGISTMTGNQKPLIVLDGYPTDLSLNDVNPNEIETVTILKDAAAAAIYGVRASNGVIIIDRKKGIAGRTQFAFRSTVSVKPHENYSRYRYDNTGLVNINDFRTRYQDGTISSWASYRQSEITGSFPYLTGIVSDSALNLMIDKSLGLITQQQMEDAYVQLVSYNNAKDYERYFLRNAVTQQYNLNISGGNAQSLYYITGNYLQNKFNQKNNDSRKVQLSGRYNLMPTKRLSLELLTDYNETIGNAAPIPDINKVYQEERFADANGNPLPIIEGSYKTGSRFSKATQAVGFLDQRMYPLTEMNEVNTRTRIADYRITANIRYKIGGGFDASLGGIYESSGIKQSRYATENSSLTRALMNKFVQPATGSTAAIYNLPKGGYLQSKDSLLRSYTLRAQLNYNKQFASIHSFNAIIGTEVRKITGEGNKTAAFGYNDQTLLQQPIDYYKLLASKTQFNGIYLYNPTTQFSDFFAQTYSDDRFVSGYMNVVYAFRNRYSFTGSMRIDQSNLFGTDPKYKYKPLWSLGLAWNVDREGFMQNVNWVNALKLRVAKGFNGNVSKMSLPQAIASYTLNDVFTPSYTVLQLSTPANSGLRWEQTDNFNTGIDFTIFKNISVNIDYYSKRSTDVLGYVATDPFRGASPTYVNEASIDNKGLEFTLNADWIKRRKFNWNTGLVVSYNKSKVLETYVPQPTIAAFSSTSLPTVSSQAVITAAGTGYMKGEPAGIIYSYRYAGMDANGNAQYYNSKGAKTLLTSSIDEGFASLDARGTSIPTTNLGLSNRIDVGNFYFFAMVNYYGGFVVRTPLPNARAPRPMQGVGDYWKKAGDENTATLPSSNYMAASGTTYLANSDRFIVNGAYLTIGDVTASYNLHDVPFLKRAGFTNFELKLQASNLYTVGFNKDNYSVATGSYLKRYLTPTYTIGLFTNF